MTNSVVDSGKKQNRKIKEMSLVAIVILTAMLTSLTLAWFAQSLYVKQNVLASAGVTEMKITVLKQEKNAAGAFENPPGGVFLPGNNEVEELSNFSDDSFTSDPATDVLFVSNVRDNGNKDEFRPLKKDTDETGKGLGYDTIEKRLIVRNETNHPMSFLMGFDVNDYFKASTKQESMEGRKDFLPEAINVNVYEVEKQADNTWKPNAAPIAAFNNVGAEELNKLSLRGTIPAATGSSVSVIPSDRVYQFRFQIDPGASALYAGGKFTIDLTVDGFNSTGETYFIKDAEDMKNVFGYYTYEPKNASGGSTTDELATQYVRTYHEGEMKADNATVILLNDITYTEDIYCPYLFNLQTGGYDLTSSGTLEINAGAAQTKWGTIDFGASDNVIKDSYGAVKAASQITFSGKFKKTVCTKEEYAAQNYFDAAKTGSVLINAPQAAVRWIASGATADKSSTTPAGTQPGAGSVVRRFNGTEGKNVSFTS